MIVLNRKFDILGFPSESAGFRKVVGFHDFSKDARVPSSSRVKELQDHLKQVNYVNK